MKTAIAFAAIIAGGIVLGNAVMKADATVGNITIEMLRTNGEALLLALQMCFGLMIKCVGYALYVTRQR